MRMLLAAALLAFPTVVSAQPPEAVPATMPPPPPPVPATPPAPKPATVTVMLTTAAGPITLVLETERAPITTANFLRYVDAKRLDRTTIYRAVKVQPGYGLVQGGVRDPAKLYPPIKLEPTGTTGLTHDDGSISMAHNAPDSAQADWFVTIGSIPSMDADPKPGGDPGFAVFGHVTTGMDLFRTMLDAPTAAGGPAAMKGQMLVQPVHILTARRVR